ncbi:MAG: succinate dehydrogenase/fumarate reductase iron-sulfur subunit [Chloroflexota bacterium]
MKGDERTIRVVRTGEGGRRYFQVFRVPCGPQTTVLDGLTYIHRHLDRTLAFRYACRQAMCGTCGVVVNGVERLACYTLLRAVPGRVVTVEPLRHLPVVRDLVVDLGPFLRTWGAVGPAFVGAADDTGPAQIRPDEPDRRVIDRHRECISCGLCYSACDVVGSRPGFPGPAALNHALCLVLDRRDGARQARLKAVDGPDGCWACHGLLTCAAVCPKGLEPAAAIERLKRLVALGKDSVAV